MYTIRLKTQVNSDGSVQLHDLPPNQDIEILLVYQAIAHSQSPRSDRTKRSANRTFFWGFRDIDWLKLLKYPETHQKLQ